jgi:hypothetical protein
MCWYSAQHSGHDLEQAEAGQRLAVRKMHCGANWVVKEKDREAASPAAVCLMDGTRAVFRPTEIEQSQLRLSAEPEAVFRMVKGSSRRDLFEFADGRQIEVDQLPPGLIFDVLMVPGKEGLSDVLNAPEPERVPEHEPIFMALRRLVGTR